MSQDIHALKDLVAAIGVVGRLALEVKNKGGFAFSEIPDMLRAVNALGAVAAEASQLLPELQSLSAEDAKLLLSALVDALVKG